MRTNLIKKSMLLLLAGLLAVLTFAAVGLASPSETVTAQIPVTARGADCTAVLKAPSGAELDRVFISADATEHFTVTVTGFVEHRFIIELLDEDTDSITFDRVVYNVRVWLFYEDDYSGIYYVIEADPLGVLGGPDSGKPESVIFVNITETPTPTPAPGETPTPAPGETPTPAPGETPKPTPPGNPQTGDRNIAALGAVLVSFGVLLAFILVIVGKRRREATEEQ